MSNAPTQQANRLDRRKARTRAALIRAAQTLIAEGRTNVPILEITQAADVGMGSFYNHFETKEQLFEAAVEAVMDGYGQLLDDLTGDIEDPAEVFACSFRLTGRLQRREPELSRVFLNNVLRLLSADSGLAPRARRDITGRRGCRPLRRRGPRRRGDDDCRSPARPRPAAARPAGARRRGDHRPGDRGAAAHVRRAPAARRTADRSRALPLPDIDAVRGDGSDGLTVHSAGHARRPPASPELAPQRTVLADPRRRRARASADPIAAAPRRRSADPESLRTASPARRS